MKIFKKIVPMIIVILICLPIAVFANNNVESIDIDVTVYDDGSAYITQIWNGNFNEGTENYIQINTNGITITDFKVSDLNGEYTLVDNWDINAGFEEKKCKCGINEIGEGIELCFGISEYGKNRYAIEYIVHNFITSYSDYDGTNFMFINPGMNTFPTDVRVSIILANGKQLIDENTNIWGFGYNGQIEFQNGGVTAYTTEALEGEEYLIVMMELDKGLINPLNSSSKSFEEVKDIAMQSSDYGNSYSSKGFLNIIIIAGLMLLVITVSFIKRKQAIRKFYKEANYYRDVPNKGNIVISNYLAQTFDVAKDESLIIGALILSMINKHCIEPITEEKTLIFGKTKTSVSLELIKVPENKFEEKLYNILIAAAGADKVLQEKELKKYCEKNYEYMNAFIKEILGQGKEDFKRANGFFKNAGKCIKDLSEIGKKELAEIMGLKKYLTDFSLIAEREISDAVIWKEYLVYATLFGIADKVIEQFKKLYPEKIVEIETYNRNIYVANMYYHTMYDSARRAEQVARTAGSGGRSSFGGGGGFSGGGFGGGSR